LTDQFKGGREKKVGKKRKEMDGKTPLSPKNSAYGLE